MPGSRPGRGRSPRDSSNATSRQKRSEHDDQPQCNNKHVTEGRPENAPVFTSNTPGKIGIDQFFDRDAVEKVFEGSPRLHQPCEFQQDAITDRQQVLAPVGNSDNFIQGDVVILTQLMRLLLAGFIGAWVM